tara:strand:- start:875 stop:1291 length:417 start_codon:yes stop_codon:yes gene_type:complete
MSLLVNIKKNEGYISTVYKDSLGIDTIGYGFAIKDLNLEEDICELILQRKIDALRNEVSKRFKWYNNMPIIIKDVVIEMCYQMGVNGFSKFKKTINYLSKEKFSRASLEMLDSKWAVQTPGRAKQLSERVKNIGEDKS